MKLVLALIWAAVCIIDVALAVETRSGWYWAAGVLAAALAVMNAILFGMGVAA